MSPAAAAARSPSPIRDFAAALHSRYMSRPRGSRGNTTQHQGRTVRYRSNNAGGPRPRSGPRALLRAGPALTSNRAHLEHVAVVAGLAGNAKLPAAVEFCHHRHHGHDRPAPAILERSPHAWLLAELDQVSRGWKRQLEASALAARQRLARRHPD